MKPFLSELAQYLIDKGWNQIKNYTLVFPMQRASVYMRMYFSEALQRDGVQHPVVLPRMLTIDQLIEDLSSLTPHNELRAVCRLHRIYCKYTGSTMPLDAFYGWGRQLLQDFSNIESTLADPEKVISNLAEAQVLDNEPLDKDQLEALQQLVNLPCNNESMRKYFMDLWSNLPNIYRDFTQEQSKAHLGTRGACLRDILDHWDITLQRLEDRTYIFVGFHYLMPAEQELIDRLRSLGKAEMRNDSVSAFAAAGADKANDSDKDSFDVPERVIDSASAPITAIATTSANAQVQYAGQWLSEHVQTGKRTAVVITDESMLESLLYTLPANLKGVNITKGYPLKSTPIYPLVLRACEEVEDKHLSLSESIDYIIAQLEEEYLSPTQEESTEQHPSDVEHTWQALLQAEAYTQAVILLQRFGHIISEDVLPQDCSLHTLHALIRRAMDSVNLPFHGEPIEEVQLIGVLETRLLDFDNLLILNVEEGVVPGAGKDYSFIPYDIRRAYHIQTREDETKVYAYNFFRLLQRASDITMLFSEASGEMNKKSMSRFLMQMLVSERYKVKKMRISEPLGLDSVIVKTPDKQWKDVARNGVLKLSPSALSTYIECPRQFYLKYIEGIHEPEADTLLFSPNHFGSLLHSTIQHAYDIIIKEASSNLITKDMLQSRIEENAFAPLSAMALEAAYMSEQADYNEHHQKNAIGEQLFNMADHEAENEVIKGMLYHVLRYDSEHIAPFRMLGQEQSCSRELHIPNIPEMIRIAGTIDRLDALANEKIMRIVDYKSGGFSDDKIKDRTMEQIFADPKARYMLQTLIYCWLAEKLPISGGYHLKPYLLFTQKCSADGSIRVNGSAVTDFANSVSNDLEHYLTNMLQAIYDDTAFEQCPEKDCSAFCPYHSLCNRKVKEEY